MYGVGLKGMSGSIIARLEVSVTFEGQPRVRIQTIEISLCDHNSNFSNNHRQSLSFPKYYHFACQIAEFEPLANQHARWAIAIMHLFYRLRNGATPWLHHGHLGGPNVCWRKWRVNQILGRIKALAGCHMNGLILFQRIKQATMPLTRIGATLWRQTKLQAYDSCYTSPEFWIWTAKWTAQD